MVIPKIHTTNEDRWKPAKGSWVETYQKTGTETGKNVFNSEEPNKAWSRGMNDLAIVDALENGLEPNTEDSYGTPISSTEALITKMQTMDMIDSSVFGMDTTFDFGTSKTVSQTIDGTVVPIPIPHLSRICLRIPTPRKTFI